MLGRCRDAQAFKQIDKGLRHETLALVALTCGDSSGLRTHLLTDALDPGEHMSDAAKVEDTIRPLLRVADSDHPLVRRLGR